MRGNGFTYGMLAGAALGVLLVMAFSQEARHPVVETAEEMGNGMRRMWRRGRRMTGQMLPPELQ